LGSLNINAETILFWVWGKHKRQAIDLKRAQLTHGLAIKMRRTVEHTSTSWMSQWSDTSNHWH